ncbi:MAG: YdcF family protein [Lachnospiraceae bacterium]|nr:YdcF family protein [Lachnospiraceae bacterium]
MKKFLKFLLILVLIAVLAAAGIIAYVRVKEGRRILKSVEDAGTYDAILVLGCGVYPDGSLSPMLRYRLECVLTLYKQGVSDTVYVTGDHRKGEYDEVDHMIAFLKEGGIPEEKLIPDYEGHSTYLSMTHASKDLAGKKVLAVTQRYHLYRAMYIGQTYGLLCDGCAAQDWGLSSGTVYRHARELAATLKDWGVCTFAH